MMIFLVENWRQNSKVLIFNINIPTLAYILENSYKRASDQELNKFMNINTPLVDLGGEYRLNKQTAENVIPIFMRYDININVPLKLHVGK